MHDRRAHRQPLGGCSRRRPSRSSLPSAPTAGARCSACGAGARAGSRAAGAAAAGGGAARRCGGSCATRAARARGPRSGASVRPVTEANDDVGGVVGEHPGPVDAAASRRWRSWRACARGCARPGRASPATRAGRWPSGGGRRRPRARTARASRAPCARQARSASSKNAKKLSSKPPTWSSISRRKSAAPPVAPNTS